MADSTNWPRAQMPLRASADVNPARVITQTGQYTGAQAASFADRPVGISAEWTKDAPLPGASTLHAKVATTDNISYHGPGDVCHAVVGTALTGVGLVGSDSAGKLKAFVPPGWFVGVNGDPTPVDAMAVTYVNIGYIGSTFAQLSATGFKVLRGVGSNGAGAVTLTGAAVGDRLIGVFGEATAGGALIGVANDGTVFESTITVINQIQQISASNLSANNYVFLLAPALA